MAAASGSWTTFHRCGRSRTMRVARPACCRPHPPIACGLRDSPDRRCRRTSRGVQTRRSALTSTMSSTPLPSQSSSSVFSTPPHTPADFQQWRQAAADDLGKIEIAPEWIVPPEPLATSAGAHRFVWDLRRAVPAVLVPDDPARKKWRVGTARPIPDRAQRRRQELPPVADRRPRSRIKLSAAVYARQFALARGIEDARVRIATALAEAGHIHAAIADRGKASDGATSAALSPRTSGCSPSATSCRTRIRGTRSGPADKSQRPALFGLGFQESCGKQSTARTPHQALTPCAARPSCKHCSSLR